MVAVLKVRQHACTAQAQRHSAASSEDINGFAKLSQLELQVVWFCRSVRLTKFDT